MKSDPTSSVAGPASCTYKVELYSFGFVQHPLPCHGQVISKTRRISVAHARGVDERETRAAPKQNMDARPRRQLT